VFWLTYGFLLEDDDLMLEGREAGMPECCFRTKASGDFSFLALSDKKSHPDL